MRRDYHKKNLRNPYSNKRHTERQGRGKRVLVFFGILLGIGFVYWLNTTPYFALNVVRVEGVSSAQGEQQIKDMVRAQLGERRFLLFEQRSSLFFNSKKIKNQIAQQFNFENISVHKKFPNTINVQITEKVSSLIWVTNSKQYYIGREGEVLGEVGTVVPKNQGNTTSTEVIRIGGDRSVPIVYDSEERELTEGQFFVNPVLVSFIKDVHQSVYDFSDFYVSHYTIDRLNSDQLRLVTDEGWQVLFSTKDAVDEQLSRLFLTLRNKVHDRSKLEYIDLRFGEKIFLK